VKARSRSRQKNLGAGPDKSLPAHRLPLIEPNVALLV
jgi:hypothetical protein